MHRMAEEKKGYAIFITLAIVLAIFAIRSNADDGPVMTANLEITPSPYAKPGTPLKFKTTIYHNPNFQQPPGTMIECRATRHDFSWVSEDRFFAYPESGKQVTIYFTKEFTIPSDAKSGDTFDFYLTWGIWYPASPKASVKVLMLRQKKPVLKKTKKPVIKKRIEAAPATPERDVRKSSD